MPDRNTRDGLVAATRELLWDRGYESTSPRAIMEASGAGQGSFYHHFPSKRDLAAAALEAVADDLIAGLDEVFDPRRPALDRVEAWLLLPRNALAGCRLGRMAMEKSVVEDDVLRRPVVRYFRAAEKRLGAALAEAQQARQLSRQVGAGELAAMLLAVVQGGYLLSRVHRDREKLPEAARAAVSILKLHRASG